LLLQAMQVLMKMLTCWLAWRGLMLMRMMMCLVSTQGRQLVLHLGKRGLLRQRQLVEVVSMVLLLVQLL